MRWPVFSKTIIGFPFFWYWVTVRRLSAHPPLFYPGARVHRGATPYLLIREHCGYWLAIRAAEIEPLLESYWVASPDPSAVVRLVALRESEIVAPVGS